MSVFIEFLTMIAIFKLVKERRSGGNTIEKLKKNCLQQDWDFSDYINILYCQCLNPFKLLRSLFTFTKL